VEEAHSAIILAPKAQGWIQDFAPAEESAFVFSLASRNPDERSEEGIAVAFGDIRENTKAAISG